MHRLSTGVALGLTAALTLRPAPAQAQQHKSPAQHGKHVPRQHGADRRRGKEARRERAPCIRRRDRNSLQRAGCAGSGGTIHGRRVARLGRRRLGRRRLVLRQGLPFNMFSPCRSDPASANIWRGCIYGGGLETAREMFAKYNVHNIPCALIPPEASGWFRKEIKSVDDLKGLKMRFFGLGAKVMEKLGVSTMQLAPGEIFQALQARHDRRHRILVAGNRSAARLPPGREILLLPGLASAGHLLRSYINKKKWDAMSDQHKAIIELACGDPCARRSRRAKRSNGRRSRKSRRRAACR